MQNGIRTYVQKLQWNLSYEDTPNKGHGTLTSL